MKIFGAKFNMFCSPQPYGIFNRLSIFDKLGPIKSPVKIKRWTHHTEIVDSFVTNMTAKFSEIFDVSKLTEDLFSYSKKESESNDTLIHTQSIKTLVE